VTLKYEVVTPIYLAPNISKADGDTNSVTMEHIAFKGIEGNPCVYDLIALLDDKNVSKIKKAANIMDKTSV